ncbi:NB-ARC domain-containing protein [Spirillospora sp. CA-253888]
MDWSDAMLLAILVSGWTTVLRRLYLHLRARPLDPSKPTPPSELPPLPAFFEGRDRELRQLKDALLARSERGEKAIALIHGSDGMGKTALAIYLAAALREAFPEGELFARLSGPGRAADAENLTADVLQDFVFALQSPGATTPDGLAARLARYQQLTESRRLLVVLDDVPSGLDVTRLLPAGHTGGVIITTREPITGLALADDQICELGPLSQDASVRLLEGVTGRREPVLAQLAEQCAGFPLALRLAANALAHRPGWQAHTVLRAMTSVERPSGVEPQPLDPTYGFLSADERLALRCLASIDGPDFAPWMLAAVAQLKDDDDAEVLAARLANMRLLERHSPELSAEPRYLIDEPVRAYAQARAVAEDEPQVRTRRTELLRRAREDQRTEYADRQMRERVFRWLQAGDLARALTEARAALALATELADVGMEAAAHCAVAEIAAELGNLDEAEQMAQRSVDHMNWQEARSREPGTRVPLPDLGTRARAHRCLGHALRRRGKWEAAAEHLDKALGLAQSAADTGEQVRVLAQQAVLAGGRGRHAEAEAAVRRAGELCDMDGAEQLPIVRLAQGISLLCLDRFDEAVSALDRAKESAGRAGQRLAEAQALYWIAAAWLQQKDYEAAQDVGTLGLQAFIEMRHRYGTARCRHTLGEVALRLGRPEEAVWMLREAVEALHGGGDGLIEERVRAVLTEAHQKAGTERRSSAVLRSVDGMLPRRWQVRSLAEQDRHGMAG